MKAKLSLESRGSQKVTPRDRFLASLRSLRKENVAPKCSRRPFLGAEQWEQWSPLQSGRNLALVRAKMLLFQRAFPSLL